MWQTKYASAVPKNLGVDFRPCSEGDFLTGRSYSVLSFNNIAYSIIFSTKKECNKRSSNCFLQISYLDLADVADVTALLQTSLLYIFLERQHNATFHPSLLWIEYCLSMKSYKLKIATFGWCEFTAKEIFKYKDQAKSHITCSWHIFTNFESKNSQKKFHENVLFSFKWASNCLFFSKQTVLATFWPQ